jgi:NADH:ubiquinone oxidoreductase subunit F (NADH-binding)
VLSSPTRRPNPSALPRLLSGMAPDGARIGLSEHLGRWGPLELSHRGSDLVDDLESSGLVGHGGAAFPVGAKWRSVRSAGSRAVVVANGAEGEPASAKDALLLTRAPHLVFDGASAAAAALGASRVVAYVPMRLLSSLQRDVRERHEFGLDPVDIEITGAPEAFIAGQESAVVNALNGRGNAMPTFLGLTPIRVSGVSGRPTLVHNVETLAHVALIARYGAEWYRSVGSERCPGTMLLTVSGRFKEPVVIEAPRGTPLREVLDLSEATADRYQGALLGGYGGTWVSMPTLLDIELSERSAKSKGATFGPGVVVLLPRSVCPLAEVARVVRYMHRQAAGQCGPCVHGLAGLDSALDALAFRPARRGGRVDPIVDLCRLVDGRGACRHPDGVARFVRTACSVFSVEVSSHLRNGPCNQVSAPSVLPFRGRRPARPSGRGARLR